MHACDHHSLRSRRLAFAPSTHATTWVAVAFALTACGDSATRPDAAVDPVVDAATVDRTVVRVSTMAADSNDGFVAPVRTLKRAMEIASGDSKIKTIALAAGRYDAANGELFPRSVPAGVTIQGPAGGGAIIVGTKTDSGLVLDTGALVHVELEDFAVAISSTGVGDISNVRVRSSALAVRVETTGRLTVDKLDIGGTGMGCSKGIELVGAAELDATGLETNGLGPFLEIRDQSVATIRSSQVVSSYSSGPESCSASVLIVEGKKLDLVDTIVEGGYVGIHFKSPSTAAVLTNTKIRGMHETGIGGFVAMFAMTGGEVSNHGRIGVSAQSGDWAFANVEVAGNPLYGIHCDRVSAIPVKVGVRGATVRNNLYGLALSGCAADLGTAVNPGNNVLQPNSHVGLAVGPAVVGDPGDPQRVDASGNTWRPNVQGADQQGQYAHTDISGPVQANPGDNFGISAGWTIHM